jgi:hypothetical protein
MGRDTQFRAICGLSDRRWGYRDLASAYGTGMTVCSHTGISLPECSCRACVQAQIERHAPALLGADGDTTAPTIEMAAVRARHSRFRLAGRLRRPRRAA